MGQAVRAQAKSTAGDAPKPGGKVRHLVHVFPTFDAGGVQIRMSDVMNRLGAGYRHTILPLDGRSGCASRIDSGVDATLAPSPDKQGSLPVRLLRYRQMLKALKPDLVLTYNWGAIEWTLAHGLHSLGTRIHLESGFGPDEASGQKARRVYFRRLALRGIHRLVVPSFVLVEIAKRRWRVPADKILHVPNGVDCTRFNPDRARLPRPPLLPDPGVGDLLVGTAAPLRPEKNLKRLLRVFAQATRDRRAKLVILGDGPERESLHETARELGVADRVHLPGHSDQVHAVLPWLDVYAMSSDTEQMPNGLVQAMASGLPVAATDVGDIGRIVAPANKAFVVGKDDEHGFVDGLARLLDDRTLRKRLGAENRSRATDRYTVEGMAESYRALFEQSLAALP